MATYLKRYLAGEHETVWGELMALGAAVREEPIYADALAVARATMRRVRANLEMLIPRLEAVGYTFKGDRIAVGPQGYPPVLAEPDPKTVDYIEEIERDIGPLPLSLRAFYETIGAVNLVGDAPEGSDWPAGPQADPLFIYGIGWNYEIWRDINDIRELYREEGAEEQELPSFEPHLFPDFLLKYDIGGVGAVGIEAPTATIDGHLTFEGGYLDDTFVEYLRFAIRYGGYPGIGGKYAYKGDYTPPREFAAYLEGLLPF